MRSRLNLLAASGLVLGGFFGMLGTLVSAWNVRAILWAIDSAGLVVATSLLTLRFVRKGNDIVAAGFLVFAIGEAVMLSGTALSVAASAPSFAAGSALWASALVLTSVPRGFALWTHAAGIIAAILFAVTSLQIFWGKPVTPLTHPLPLFGYPFLVLTFAGWIWNLLREGARD